MWSWSHLCHEYCVGVAVYPGSVLSVPQEEKVVDISMIFGMSSSKSWMMMSYVLHCLLYCAFNLVIGTSPGPQWLHVNYLAITGGGDCHLGHQGAGYGWPFGWLEMPRGGLPSRIEEDDGIHLPGGFVAFYCWGSPSVCCSLLILCPEWMSQQASLLIPSHAWSHIALNFVTVLPPSLVKSVILTTI